MTRKVDSYPQITFVLLALLITSSLLFLGASKHNSPSNKDSKLQDEVQKLQASVYEVQRQLKEAKDQIPPGTVISFAGPLKRGAGGRPIPPKGWLYCDGTYYEVKTYPNLYKALITPGRTTAHYGEKTDPTSKKKLFRIPSLQGTFLRGTTYSIKSDPNFSSRKPPFGKENDKISTSGFTMYKNFPVGTEQGFATALPTTAFQTEKKTHKHSHNHSVAKRAFQCLHHKGQKCTKLYKNRMFVEYKGMNIDITSKTLQYRIQSGGDKETRPRNTYVHYLIKY